MSNETEKMDVDFEINGDTIAAGHEYHLYSALSKICNVIHEDNGLGIGIHKINGDFIPGQRLKLTEKSKLTIRTTSDKVGKIINLIGQKILIGEDAIRIKSIGRVNEIRPSNMLYSRMVTFREMEPVAKDPKIFMEMAKKYLDKYGLVNALPIIKMPEKDSPFESEHDRLVDGYAFRSFKIKDFNVIGFPLVICNLSMEESLFLQHNGMGGRHHFGCGMFIHFRTRMS